MTAGLYFAGMEASSVPIRVLCRVRPLNPTEEGSEFVPVIYPDLTSISLSVSEK